MSTPQHLFTLGLGSTALGALLALAASNPRAARWIGWVSSTVALVAFVTLAMWLNLIDAAPPLASSFSITPLSALVLCLTTLLSLGAQLALERRVQDGPGVAAVLLTTTALLLTTTNDLDVLAAAWMAVPLPGTWALRRSGHRRSARLVSIFLVGGGLPTAATLVTLARLEASGSTLALPPGARWGLFVALLFGVVARMGIVPLHAWLGALVERGPTGVAMLLSACSSGAFLLVRVGAAWFAEELHAALPFLLTLGLITAVYGALVAWGHPRLLGAVGGLVLSVGGLVLGGLCADTPSARGGALSLWVAESIAVGGLIFLARSLNQRVGELDTQRFHGLARGAPRLTTGFFVLGMALVGFPGTASFAGEDLLVEGLLSVNPIAGLVLLVVTALNAITVLRLGSRAFLGDRGPAIRDLLPTEAGIAVVFAAVLIIAGLAPGPLVRSASRPTEMHHVEARPR